MKERIPQLLLQAGTLSIEQIGEALGNPHPRTLRSWLADLRNQGRVHQVYAGRSADNGRIYAYEIGPASRNLPAMRATEYRWAQPSGSVPETVRRLMAPE